MHMVRIAGRLLALSALGAALCAAAPARADLRMCNNTNNRVSVALGYTDGQNWVSEGWWNLKSLDCVTLLRGALAAEYYYLYAMDERGGEWKGKVFMCTSDREFKIDGRQDCFVRGYNRTGFFEVDTGKDFEELDGAADRPGKSLSPRSLLTREARPKRTLAVSAADYGRTPVQSRRRRVKIIATLGPASADRKTIAALFAAGADVFRINMSHASHDGMRERVAMIRDVEEETGRPIGILVDLQGPKLRLGTFASGGADLQRGEAFILDGDSAPGGQARVYLPHPEILSSLAKGHRILIDDGKVMLRVAAAEGGRALTVVEVPGRVSNKKGVSLPDTTIPTSAMTDKDHADLAAALEEDIDWIALSFVQRPEDIVEVKEIVKGRALVMAKIEKPQAVQRIEEIMAVADALMVARGDLGVEMPLEQVPGIQKTLTRLARRLGKPVVVATQMLESMISAPVPTRAEVSDVATAVFEGADAVMLSAESASGQYPHEAVATMNRIAEAVESEKIYPSIIEAQRAAPEATGADAIAEATRDVAETLNLKVICAWTSSGSTGLRIARQRPRSSILALTPIESVARRLAVVWGVHPIVTDDARDERDMADRACRHAYIEGFAGEGERIIVVAGVPFGTPGATNNLRIATVGT